MVVTVCDVPPVNSGCGNFLTMPLKFTILTSDVSRKKKSQPFSFLQKNGMENSVLSSS